MGSGSTFGLFGLLAGASLVFFAFIGFDVVATTAEETRNPQHAVSRGILGSLAIVTVLYVAVTLVVTGMVNYRQLATTTTPSGTPDRKTLATAFADNGVDWAANIISIGALAGLTTVVLVLMLGQVRVLFAMSRDGLLPRALARTGQHSTPVRPTVLVGTLIAIAATFFEIGRLEEMVKRRHPVRLHPRVRRRDYPPPHSPRPAPQLPYARRPSAARSWRSRPACG